MNSLRDICQMIAEIEEGLAYGEINFTYNRMMCVMKQGHPADILDEILSIIGWDVFKGETPEREKIEEVYNELKQFKSCFKVKELSQPIEALDEYLYPRIQLTFPIYVEGSGESFVEYGVTEQEFQKIKRAKKKGADFEEAAGLKTLYGKIMKAAKRKLQEDIDLTSDDIDCDELEYSIDFPEDLED